MIQEGEVTVTKPRLLRGFVGVTFLSSITKSPRMYIKCKLHSKGKEIKKKKYPKKEVFFFKKIYHKVRHQGRNVDVLAYSRV